MIRSATGAASFACFLYSAFMEKRSNQPAVGIVHAAIVIPHALRSVSDAGPSAEARASNSFVAP